MVTITLTISDGDLEATSTNVIQSNDDLQQFLEKTLPGTAEQVTSAWKGFRELYQDEGAEQEEGPAIEAEPDTTDEELPEET